MEDTLGENPYLAGTFSYADIAFYMASLFGERMGAPLTGDTPNLLRWRDRMTARPAVQQVVKPMAAFLTSQGRLLPAFLAATFSRREAR
jgi:glutathione S-transferase